MDTTYTTSPERPGRSTCDARIGAPEASPENATEASKANRRPLGLKPERAVTSGSKPY